MRYFLVSYYKKANGQMDEVVAVSKRLKTKDIQISSVILDFKDCCVIKASMNGEQVPKDWTRIRDFYHQYYTRLIDDLEEFYKPVNDTASQ